MVENIIILGSITKTMSPYNAVTNNLVYMHAVTRHSNMISAVFYV